MSRIAEQLDLCLRGLDRVTAAHVERLVEETLALAGAPGSSDVSWPAGYFELTAGALAGERLERPEQGGIEHRNPW